MSGSRRLGYLDALRGLAACYVVVSHCWDTVFSGSGRRHTTVALVSSPLGFGRFAVTLFILISGFSLGLVAWRNQLVWPGGAWAFIKRRVRRIVPPYLVAVILCSALAVSILRTSRVSAFYLPASHIRPLGLVDHALLLQDLRWAGPAGSNAFWSIAVEFHIYLVFLAVLPLFRRRPTTYVGVAASFYLLTGLAYALPSGAAARELQAINPSLYGVFFLGFATCALTVPNASLSPRVWRRSMVGLLVIGVAVCAVSIRHEGALSPLNDLWIGPILALLLGEIALGRLRILRTMLDQPVFRWLGASSYSLYLIHAAVVELVWQVLVEPTHLAPAWALLTQVVVGLAASILAARLLFHTVESRYLHARRTTSADAATATLDAAASEATPPLVIQLSGERIDQLTQTMR